MASSSAKGIIILVIFLLSAAFIFLLSYDFEKTNEYGKKDYKNNSLASQIVPDDSLSLNTTSNDANRCLSRLYSEEGNIAIIEDDGTLTYKKYDEYHPEGVPKTNDVEIAKCFYEKNNDDYDFLVIIASSDKVATGAYQFPVKNEVQGIGLSMFDNTQMYGSNNRLQGIIRLASLDGWQNSGMENQMDILMHEIGHQWAAFIGCDIGEDCGLELTYSHMHWHDNLDIGTGGLMAAGCTNWTLKDGKYLNYGCERNKFSLITQYLMGLIAPEDVKPLRVMQQAGYGFVVNKTMTIQDIVDNEGERIPSYKNSQKDFRIALIILTNQENRLSNDNVELINDFIGQFPEKWAFATCYKSRIGFSVS